MNNTKIAYQNYPLIKRIQYLISSVMGDYYILKIQLNLLLLSCGKFFFFFIQPAILLSNDPTTAAPTKAGNIRY